jgi:hypothetical protein
MPAALRLGKKTQSVTPNWHPKNEKTTCPTSANGWLRSANAPLMMPNERRI